jgi:chromate reductase, NAD(P)H dehydrogenase (quinone)
MNDFNIRDGTANVLGIVGSLRNNSFNEALLKTAAGMLPNWVKFDTFDISEIPHYNQDVEDSGIPKIVQKFKQKIRQADAIIIATPEYNGSVTGVLKDALDWASRPYGESAFGGKPIGVLVAVSGKRGGRSVLNHIRLIIEYLDAKLLGEPVLLQLAPQKFDESGKLSDPDVLAQTNDLVRQIVENLPSPSKIEEVQDKEMLTLCSPNIRTCNLPNPL